jgi:hypothetical protein
VSRAELDRGGQHLELIVAAGHAGEQDVLAQFVHLVDALLHPVAQNMRRKLGVDLDAVVRDGRLGDGLGGSV